MIDWKGIAEMMAHESADLVREYRTTIRIQRGIIAMLLILFIVAVIV